MHLPFLTKALLLLAGLWLAGSQPLHAADASPAPAVDAARIQLAIYLPASARGARLFIGDAWLTPGRALEESVLGVMQQSFLKAMLVSPGSPERHSLLLTLAPEWKVEPREIRLTLRYKVFAKDGEPLLSGENSAKARPGDWRLSTGFYTAAVDAAQQVAKTLRAELQPTPERFPALQFVRDVQPVRYVNREKPVQTGTGFFINASGQVLTAAHVLEDCALVELRRDGKPLPAQAAARSALLDLAVIDTGTPVTTLLPLRQGHALQLGESVSNVGFPLQPLLSANPSLTRGNISGEGALAGALGQFQFSAPIQPGSSGGPVVSDGGELLGVTLATLNPKPLMDKGILPQNVNFALHARHVAAFLRQHRIAFSELPPPAVRSMEVANRAALGAVVSLACYQ